MDKQKKTVGLASGEIRVINIGKEAIFEWLAESMIAHGKDFFDIEDICSVSFQCAYDKESCQFTCTVIDATQFESAQSIPVMNMEEVRNQSGITTTSLFGDDERGVRYKVLNYERTPGLMDRG